MPKILLSGKRFTEPYAEAVKACGGEPTVLYLPAYDKPLDTLLDYDGLLLCGGNDLDPVLYGQEINGSGAIDRPRDDAEWFLLRAYLEQKKPIFGVCRGHQLLNAFFGGDLIQDLPNREDHSARTDFSRVHTVTAEAGSILAALYGEKPFPVNSFHHQALDRVAAGFRVTARSEDGVVEGMEHESLPIFSVQFHPEQMCCAFAREEVVDGLALFRHFLSLTK